MRWLFQRRRAKYFLLAFVYHFCTMRNMPPTHVCGENVEFEACEIVQPTNKWDSKRKHSKLSPRVRASHWQCGWHNDARACTGSNQSAMHRCLGQRSVIGLFHVIRASVRNQNRFIHHRRLKKKRTENTEDTLCQSLRLVEKPTRTIKNCSKFLTRFASTNVISNQTIFFTGQIDSFVGVKDKFQLKWSRVRVASWKRRCQRHTSNKRWYCRHRALVKIR